MINLKLYILPLLSVASFLLATLYPLFAIFLLVSSFFFLFIYFYYPDRNRYSDILLILLLSALIGYTPTIGLFYIPTVLIPVGVLYYIRERYYKSSLSVSYLSVIIAPIAVFVISVVLVFFVDETRKVLHDWIMQFFTDLTAPAKSTLERFDNNGAFTYIMNNRAEATNLVLTIMPSMQFIVVALMVFLLDKFKPAPYNNIESPKRRFRLPDFFVWFVIVFFAINFIDNESIKAISYNGLIIMVGLYFFQGVDLFNTLFDRLKIPLFLRALIFIFCYTEVAFLMLVAFIGLMNTWFKPKFFTDGEEDSDAKSK